MPMELSVPSVRLAPMAEVKQEERMADLEVLEERREAAAGNQEKYWEFVEKNYNKGAVFRVFKGGDLVWKVTTPVMCNIEQPKFTLR